MFDPSQVKLETSMAAPGILYGLCLDADNARLYGAGADWSVYSADLKEKKPKEAPPLEQPLQEEERPKREEEQPKEEKRQAEKRWTHHENYVSSLAWVDGLVVSAGYDGRIVWTNPETGEEVRQVSGSDTGWIRDLAVFPDKRRMASVADDMLVRVWDLENAVLLKTLDGHAKQSPQGYATALYALAVAPDGRHLASGDRIGTVCIWETDSGRLVRQIQSPTFYTYDARTRVRSIGGIRSLCFSPNGSQLAIGGIGKVTNVDGFVGPCRMELWDWQSGKRIRTFQDKHKAVLNDIAFHPTESSLIGAGGGDSGGVLIFWDGEQEQASYKAKPKGHIQRLILDAERQRIYLAGHGGFQAWTWGGA